MDQFEEIMDIEQQLEELGLSTTESALYSALLKTQEVTAVGLAKLTKIHRRTIYDNLNILLHKGLVSFKIKKGVRYYSAASPQTLQVFLDEKQSILDSLLPSLDSLYENQEVFPKIETYVGKQGAKAILEEVFLRPEPMYWIGGGSFFLDSLTQGKHLIEQKAKRKVIKIVQPEKKRALKLRELAGAQNIRYLPPSFLSRTGCLVCGDLVSIGIVQEKEITSVKIVSKEAAQAFRNYFEALWIMGKKIE